MEYAYRTDVWQVMFATVAGATATLTGLLFIALSLNLRVIFRVPTHAGRARETLGGLLTLLVLSLVILIPGQDRHALGSELILGSLVVTLLGFRLQIRTLRKMAAKERFRWAWRYVLLHAATACSIVAGIGLIIEQLEALYWLVPTVLIYTLWSINNAWLLVVQSAQDDPL